MDFIVDGLANGRMVRILSVVDAFTRECLALEPDVSLGSGRVTRVLDGVIAEHGRPESLRSDNGPEFCSRRMLGWAEERKIALVHIQPGRPMQNGHVESFHGRLRDECLNAHWFRTLNDVRVTLAGWRREYNCERPHSSCNYQARVCNRDVLDLTLPMKIRIHKAPDDPSVQAAMYGPLALAMLMGTDDMSASMIHGPQGPDVAGRPHAIPEVSGSRVWARRTQGTADNPLTFETTGGGKVYSLLPLHRVMDQRYSVYVRPTDGI